MVSGRWIGGSYGNAVLQSVRGLDLPHLSPLVASFMGRNRENTGIEWNRTSTCRSWQGFSQIWWIQPKKIVVLTSTVNNFEIKHDTLQTWIFGCHGYGFVRT
jgi:hypothetical protein